MKKRLLILVGLMALALSACKMGDKEVLVSFSNVHNYALGIGDLKSPKNEAKLYLGCFTDYYGNIGGIDVDVSKGSTADEKIIEGAALLLSRVYSLNFYAKKNNIALNSEDEDRVKAAAADFFSLLTNQERKALSVNQGDIQAFYRRYALALKVKKQLMAELDKNVTEDAARVMEGYVISTTQTDQATEIKRRIDAGDDFASITQVFSEGPKTIITFGREEYPEEFDRVAFTLEEGEVSPMIHTGDTIYFVKCIKKYNAEESARNKDRIIEKRQKALYGSIEESQREEVASYINMDFFRSVNLEEVNISVGGEFFSILESYGFL